ncbi:MAG TPA: SBBP repeat-containing protein [Bacteroidota bacterium]|nr:SBBP repeat-containing protein [Bacteroidota bacterium]
MSKDFEEPRDQVVERWNRHYAPNNLPSEDYPNAIACDSKGNVYVAGYTEATFTGGDYLLVRYDSRGDSVWTARYDGSANSLDEATALAVDRDDNVYVTGYSLSEGSNYDYVTLKYRPDGTREWVSRYNGDDDSVDVATAIAVDSSANVYVTGYSYTASGGYDIVTVKHNSGGSVIWVSRYSGKDTGPDSPSRIIVSNRGDVIVEGSSYDPVAQFDYITIAYRQDGIERWNKRYNRESGSDDRASDLMIDAEGDCYVTGSSALPGRGYDFVTVKYSSEGVEEWEKIYNGPSNGADIAAAVACFGDSLVYVTGTSQGISSGNDYETICYDAGGDEVWKSRYDGLQHGDDRSLAIGVDHFGRVYVSGYSTVSAQNKDIVTIVYGQGGEQISAARYDDPGQYIDIPAALGIDFQDNVYVAGRSEDQLRKGDVVVVKYQSSREFARYNRFADYADIASQISTDHAGNVLVAGAGIGPQPGSGYDFIVLKYDSGGSLIWSASYDGGFGNDMIVAMEIDTRDNVYVTGRSTGPDSSIDCVIMMYTPAGERKWLARYAGTAGSVDIPAAMAIDRYGNAYVAGSTGAPSSPADYLILKYDSTGSLRWTRRYDGTPHLNDQAVDLAVDVMGNVDVTGGSVSGGTSYDFTTIQYSPSGTLVWLKRYDYQNAYDYPVALTLDGDGDIFIAGKSNSAGTLQDFAIVKYNSSGDLEWTARYDGPSHSYDFPTSLAVDRNKNVIVTGASFLQASSFDYVTIMYSPNGSQKWIARFDGPVHESDIPVSLGTDDHDNVYVTGFSETVDGGRDFVTLRYNSNGGSVWKSSYNGEGRGDDEPADLATTHDGFIFVAGSSTGFGTGIDIVVTKYAMNQSNGENWPVRYTGMGISRVFAKACVLDPQNNIMICGGKYTPTSTLSYTTVRFTSDGIQQWENDYGDRYHYNEPTAVAIGPTGNVYATGLSYALSGNQDCLTIKYDGDGATNWIGFYDDFEQNLDFAADLVVSDNEEVYVAGYSYSRSSAYDFVIIKYDSSGAQKWVASYNGTGNGSDLASAIATDEADNTYVTGLSDGGGTGYDFATVKYDAGGAIRWAARYNGPANLDDRAVDVTVDGARSVYVTGWSAGEDHIDEIVIVKYDSNGEQRWAERFHAPDHEGDRAQAIVLDASRNVYVTGTSFHSGFRDVDYVTMSYDSDGQVRWVRYYDGPARGDDEPAALAIDGQANVYVAGKSAADDLSTDIVSLKYDSGGVLRWEQRYRGIGRSNDEPVSIKVDVQGNVYVAGTSAQNEWSIMTVIKYAQDDIAGFEPNPSLPEVFELRQNFPNPFNPRTVIRYSLPAGNKGLPPTSHVSLRVYDLLGREVKTLVDTKTDAGFKSVEWDAGSLPSGVYFCRLSAGRFTDVKKMLLIR